MHPLKPLLSSRGPVCIRHLAQQWHVNSCNTTTMVSMWAINHDSMVWEELLVSKPKRFLGSASRREGNNIKLVLFRWVTNHGNLVDHGDVLMLSSEECCALLGFCNGFSCWTHCSYIIWDSQCLGCGVSSKIVVSIVMCPIFAFQHWFFWNYLNSFCYSTNL